MSAAPARLQSHGNDAVLRNTVRRPSRRGHESLPAAAARFLCGQTLNLPSAAGNFGKIRSTCRQYEIPYLNEELISKL